MLERLGCPWGGVKNGMREMIVFRSARKGMARSRLRSLHSVSVSEHHATNNPLVALGQLLRGGREVVWGRGCIPADDAQASEEFGGGAAEHVGRVSSTEERPTAWTTRLVLGEPIGPQRSWQLHYPNCDPDNVVGGLRNDLLLHQLVLALGRSALDDLRTPSPDHHDTHLEERSETKDHRQPNREGRDLNLRMGDPISGFQGQTETQSEDHAIPGQEPESGEGSGE